MKNALLASLMILLAVPAMASETNNKNHVVGYAGVFDALDDDDYGQYGLEYRHKDVYYGLRPTIGINVTDESDVYGYAGAYWDIELPYSFVLSPNFVVGAYDHGDGKDLGGALEFRSGIELGYAFENQSRVGVAFNHISNASLYDKNPGAEAVLFSYQHGFDW